MPVPSFLSFASCFVLIMAKPQDAKAPETPSSSLLPVASNTHADSLHETPIPIISHTESFGESGNFNFSYETGNGIHFEQSGYTKQGPNVAHQVGTDQDVGDGLVQVMIGSFSYPAPDGTQISLSYVADENGYQPIGDHLPTPPPIPESIQRVLNILPKLNDQYNSDAGTVTETSS